MNCAAEGFWSRVRRQGGTLLLCLGAAAVRAAQPGPVPPAELGADWVPTAPVLHSLQEADRGMDMVRGTMWERLEAMRETPDDGLGNSPEKDMARILPDPMLGMLKQQRDAASQLFAAGDEAAGAEALRPYAGLLFGEFLRENYVQMYWFFVATLSKHEALLDSLLNEATPADARQGRAVLASSRERLREMHERVLTVDLVHTPGIPRLQSEGFGEIVARLNAERTRLADKYDAARLASTGRARSHPRSGECPAPATTTSGAPVPRIAGGPDAESYYPAELKRIQVEGTVVVTASISRQGCVTAVALAATSGSTQLDEAALSFAETLRVLPAEVGGLATEASLTFRTRFKLQD